MKRRVLILFLIIIVFNSTLNVFASENKEVSFDDETFKNAVVNELELKSHEEDIITFIFEGNVQDALNLMYDVIICELKNNLLDHKQIMLTIIALVFFSCIIKCLSDNNKYCDIAFDIIMSLVLLELFSKIHLIAKNTLSDIETFIGNSIPVYLGLNTVITGKIPYINTFFLTGQYMFFKICHNIMLPAVSLSVFFSIIGSLNDGLDFSNIKSNILTSANWINGIFTTVFLSALKILDLIIFSSDKIMYSGIKYTLAKSIPAVGGYVSESLGALIGSVYGISKVCGSALCVILVIRILLPVLQICLYSIFIKLISYIASLFTVKNVVGLLNDFSRCIGQLSIIIVICAVIFIIGLSLVVKF